MTNEDVKPDVKESQTISLNFRCNDGSEMIIKVRGSTKFGKVMRSYTEKQGRAPGSVKFGFEGTRINDYETPDMLGIEDGDQIDVNLEQLGGIRSVKQELHAALRSVPTNCHPPRQ